MNDLVELKFRDPTRAKQLAEALADVARQTGPTAVMHVCGSHEQAIARFGLRAVFPRTLDVIMGPGCPVCVTDVPEVDEGVALARQGVRIATYGDMLRVPGRVVSVEDLIAVVDFWGVKKQIRLDVVDEPVAPGDYILNHVGYAIRRIPDEEIGATLALYEEILREADLMAADVRGEMKNE